jgi:hypothetical protein
MLPRQAKCQNFSFLTSDMMTFLVLDITYVKKHAIKKSEKPDLHVIKIGKFSALDFYDVLDFFATDCLSICLVLSRWEE